MRTALFEEHQKLGGRIIDFGGWDLPVQYTGVLEEHQACRRSAGLFDVSHMGEVHVEGAGASEFLDYLVTNQPSKCAIGQAQYTAMCNFEGGIVDDLVIYRRGNEKYLLVVNASNTDKDFSWITKVGTEFQKKHPELKITNESAKYSQIAIQGRNAARILQELTKTDLSQIKTYCFAEGQVLGGISAIIARTGYTGEDGFEIYVGWSRGPELWRALLEHGTPLGLKACGLGARDTLRLEMKYALYGNELTDSTNPLEVGLGWVVKLDKPAFVGREPIAKLKSTGPAKALVGFKLKDRRIPRHGYPIFTAIDGAQIGEVTSGTQSPSLGEAIGVASLPKSLSAPGSKIFVGIRDQKAEAEVVPTPFYKRDY